MEDIDFDRALIAAAFAEAATNGWSRVGIASAARAAGLDLARARSRFPGRCALLLRFGQLADREAVTDLIPGAPVRDALFDMLMRRIDVLQAHRAGAIALFRALPFDPAAAALLAAASLRSMVWLLDAAGAEAGLLTPLRAKGLLAVWLWTVRAWQKDDSEDLSATMAALDEALGRAEKVEGWLKGPRRAEPADPAADETPTDSSPPS